MSSGGTGGRGGGGTSSGGAGRGKEAGQCKSTKLISGNAPNDQLQISTREVIGLWARF
jgi:hypothetical protein